MNIYYNLLVIFTGELSHSQLGTTSIMFEDSCRIQLVGQFDRGGKDALLRSCSWLGHGTRNARGAEWTSAFITLATAKRWPPLERHTVLRHS